MIRPSFRLGHACSSVLVVAVVLAHAACSSSEDSATSPGGASDAGPQAVPPVGNLDAGGELPDEQGGQPVTDDGDLPDVAPADAAAEEVGPDGGLIFQPGCALDTPGPYAASTCSSRLPVFTSAGLVSGTYQLTSVRVLGTATFCTDSFKVFDHAGALVVNASSPTTATLRVYDRYRLAAKPLLTAVTRYQVGATAAGTELTLGPALCAAGAKPPTTAKFGSGTTNGKKFVLLQLPYGASGSAIYRFSEP